MVPSRLSGRGRVLLLVAPVALSMATVLATRFGVDLMMVLPALSLAALVLAWPAPGVDLIMRIATRRRSSRPSWFGGARQPHLPTLTRGGRLIGASLGGRAPPALALRV